MYRCKECNAEYKEKVEYCDCGNNTFDFIEDKPETKLKKNLTLEEKSEIVSKIFLIICILLSVIIWMLPVGVSHSTPKQKSKHEVKKTEVFKNIPPIDKIWDDTPVYTPKKDLISYIPEPVTYNEHQPSAPKSKALSPQPEQIIQVKKNDKITKEVKPLTRTEPKYNPNSPEMLRYKNNLRAALFSKFAVGSIQGSGECDIQFAVDKTGKLINRKFSKESSNKTLNDTVYYMLMSVPRYSPPPQEYNGEIIHMNFKITNGDYEITIQ